MLQRLSQEVAECHRHAREARETAERAAEADKLDYLAIERRWLMLAESYELVQRITDFNAAAKQRMAAVFEQSTSVRCPSCGEKMRRAGASGPQSGSGAGRHYFKCQTCDVTALRTGPTIDA